MKTARPSDKFEKTDHPYDRGYWARYDGEARPTTRIERAGWDDCNRELAFEAQPEAKPKPWRA